MSKPTSYLSTTLSGSSFTGRDYCEDKPNVDCHMLNDTIGLCSEIHKAKLICRKHCNLCNLTDGQWCSWSSWGSCDVTCANGTQLQTRNCACPTAANSGLDCVGDSSDTKTCINDHCPVHGGWSLWENWGTCSATCGIGLQRRDRRCSNPAPSLGGLQCLGDTHEDRICFSSACADNHWSACGTWSACSKHCDIGTRTTSRTCTNPRPSLTGRYCHGDPSAVEVCNTQICPDKMVAFTATGSQTGSPGYVIRFPIPLTNYHNDYSTTTGKFTCSIPGLYHFAVTLTKTRDDIDLIGAALRVNGVSKIVLHADPADDGTIDTGSYSVSGAATFHLSVGNVVYVAGTASYFYDNYNTFFTGFLVQADN